jgi:hypothetical protein
MKKKKIKKLDKLLAETAHGILRGHSCLRVVIRSLKQRPEYSNQCGLIEEVHVLQRALKLISKAYNSLDDLETKLSLEDFQP